MLFSVLTQRYTRNKSLLFFGCESVFWALYRLYPKKNPFFSSEKILLELIPEKKDFFIENEAFSGLILRYTRKKILFSEISENRVGLYSLIFEKKSFFRPNKSFFFGLAHLIMQCVLLLFFCLLHEAMEGSVGIL